MYEIATARYVPSVHFHLTRLRIYKRSKPKWQLDLDFNYDYHDEKFYLTGQNYKTRYEDELFEAEKCYRAENLKRLIVSFITRLKAHSNNDPMDEKEVRFWISQGIDLDISYPCFSCYDCEIEDTTPLCYAAHEGDISLIRLLLKCGANPNARDFRERTAWNWMHCYYKRPQFSNYVIKSILINYGFNISESELKYANEKHIQEMQNRSRHYLYHIWKSGEKHIFEPSLRVMCKDKSDQILYEMTLAYNRKEATEMMTQIKNIEDEDVKRFCDKLVHRTYC